MKSDLAEAREAQIAAEDKIATVEGDIPSREATVEEKEAELSSREKTLVADEKSVAKREKAVGIIEREIQANTIDGEGIYAVGKDIKVGTYKTTGSPGCYYAVLNSTDTSDIADNNNVDGPAFVTVSDGQYLQLSGCAEWTLQR